MYYERVLCFRYKPAPEDQLSKAFDVLDQEKKGYLTTEELTKYMTEEGTVNPHILKLFIVWYTEHLYGV